MKKRTYDWVLIVAIIVFIWYMGDPAPEFVMQYNPIPPRPETVPDEFIQRQANFDYGESPYWDNPPDGPIPYDRVPEITQRQFDWRWKLPKHKD